MDKERGIPFDSRDADTRIALACYGNRWFFVDDTIYESILCMILYTTVFLLAFAKIIVLHIVGIGEYIEFL